MFTCSRCGARSLEDCTCRQPVRQDPHDEARLPKWAQQRLDDLRREVRRQAAQMATIRTAHEVLKCCNWFTLRGAVLPDGRAVTLYTLDNDGAHPVCTLESDDVLLIGRARKEPS